MARVRTDAAERTAQNHRLVTEEATRLGVDSLSVRQAQDARRSARGVTDIVARDIPLDDAQLIPVGVVLAAVTDFSVVKGGTANLKLTTNAREFGDVLMAASLAGQSEICAIAIYTIPRDLGLVVDNADPHASNFASWETDDA